MTFRLGEVCLMERKQGDIGERPSSREFIAIETVTSVWTYTVITDAAPSSA